MKIYLAGGVSGNLVARFRDTPNKIFEDIMRLYLAGTRSRPWLFDMKLHLAGNGNWYLLPNTAGGGYP